LLSFLRSRQPTLAKSPANTKTINDFGHLGYNSGTSGSGLPLGDRVASHLSSSHVVRFADFEFDLRSGELSRNGTSLKLQPQPAKVLTLLVSRHGEIVTRQDIAQQVWGSETFVDFEQGLNFAIRQIRSVLQDDADHPRFLETLPKRGYRFTAPVTSQLPVVEVERPIQVPPPVAPTSPARPSRRILIYLAVGLAVVSASLLAWHWGLLRQLRSKVLSPPRIESLAVLPLHNLSRDPEQEYFSDGMTDELITELARFGTFRVISHTSVERYKDTKRPLPEIARELGVDAIVEGTVMRSGDRVRITSQLIEARSDRHLWAESYDRDLSNVLALQNEVARDIANEIEMKVRERSPETGVHAINPAAHEAYLKGRYFWNKRTGDGLRKGIEYFEQATRLDPKYAAAYAGLAESYVVLNGHRFLPPTQAYPKVRAAALKALELDDGIAEAHASLGSLKWEYDWDPSGAEKEFRRAIDLNPSYATAHQWYAEELAIIGRGDEARAEIQRAKELDPLSLPISLVAGWIPYLLRDFDGAIAQYQKTLDMDANFALAHVFLGRAYIQKGNMTQAIAECQLATRQSDHPFYTAWLGYAYARAGNRHEALRILRDLESISQQKYVAAHDIAAIYAGLGEQSKAIAWLNKAYDERSYTVLLLQAEPEFDTLHSNPLFQDLVHRVGVTQ